MEKCQTFARQNKNSHKKDTDPKLNTMALRVCLATLALALLVCHSTGTDAGTGVNFVGLTKQPVTVFERGEEGYFCVKIPILLALESGTILAFGEVFVFVSPSHRHLELATLLDNIFCLFVFFLFSHLCRDKKIACRA